MKKTLLRLTLALLSLLLCLSSLAACASKGETLLTLEKDGIKVTLSANEYQLMLTRVKGTLSQYQYDVNSYTFWAQQDKYDGTNFQTLDQFYKDSVLNNCRTYLVALYLFEKEGLKLSDASIESVNTLMDELVRTDGDGSKTKLNSVLSVYGVNYDILEGLYLMQEKIKTLQNHLYGENAELLGEVVKDEYLQNNYVHFEQVFLPTYSYVFETDKNGDTIYYMVDGDQILKNISYDKGNGVPAEDKNGNPIIDDNGDRVYYVKDSNGKIAYNYVSGKPAYKLSSDGKNYLTENLKGEALEKVTKEAEQMLSDLKDSTDAEFEAAMKKQNEKNDDLAADEYTDGYYLKTTMDFAASGEDLKYLDKIVEALGDAKDGDVVMVQSGFGYHIIKKYPHSEKAYENEVNESWFSDFNANLIEYYFGELCRTYYGDITVDGEVLASVPDMLNIKINYYY